MGRREGVGAAMRAAATDFYYHSIRLVPLNLAWGILFLLALAFLLTGQVLLAALVVPLLALAVVGLARLAVLIARGEDVVLSDAWMAIRRLSWRAFLGGLTIAVAASILASNLVLGLRLGDAFGWSLATLAGWGLLGLWLLAFPFWILLADPARDGSLAGTARLTAILFFAAPGRLIRLGVANAAILALSTVFFAALITISIAFTALLTANVILPIAGRISMPESVSPR